MSRESRPPQANLAYDDILRQQGEAVTLTADDCEHAWVLYQVLYSTRRSERSQDDIIAHAARILADSRNMPEGSGARFEFEVEVAVSIRLQIRKET